MKERSRKHPDAWRLPAEELEELIAGLIRKSLKRPDYVAALIPGVSAAEIPGISKKLQSVQTAKQFLALVARVDLKPGKIIALICLDQIAELVGCERDRIEPNSLRLESPFRMRRRGVELKLHLGEAPAEVDRTLVRSIVKANRWMAMILNGKTFAEIAEAEGTSKRRVQDV
ncbi:MAG: recombinase family protein, partial [Pseudomonadota bacterium]